jgi:hypothetical protein
VQAIRNHQRTCIRWKIQREGAIAVSSRIGNGCTERERSVSIVGESERDANRERWCSHQSTSAAQPPDIAGGVDDPTVFCNEIRSRAAKLAVCVVSDTVQGATEQEVVGNVTTIEVLAEFLSIVDVAVFVGAVL